MYNGDRKWTAPVELQSLIENHELLGEFGIQFKYFKIAENEFSAESLLKIQNLVSTIFLSEVHYDLEQILIDFIMKITQLSREDIEKLQA